MTTLLTVTALEKHFRHTPVVNCPALTIQAGDFLLLTGRNGSGKSTFLRLLAGMLTPDQGTVTEVPSTKKSFYSESFFLYEDLTVAEHFTFLGSLLHEPLSTTPFERFGLPAHASKYPPELSRGLRARLGLSLTLARSANLFLLDEPLDALDGEGQGVFIELLEEQRKKRNCAIVVASHQVAPLMDFTPRELQFEVGVSIKSAL